MNSETEVMDEINRLEKKLYLLEEKIAILQGRFIVLWGVCIVLTSFISTIFMHVFIL